MKNKKSVTLINQGAKRGFTLIELSVVLLIISLVVGSVIIGRELIRAAEIRATIAQTEKFTTAVYTFREKYGGLPGDLDSASATTFGLFAVTGALAGTTGFGDGNGLIEAGSAAGVSGIGETLIFWRHLSESGMITGRYGVTGDNAISATTGTISSAVAWDVSQSLPKVKVQPGGHFIVYAAAEYNYYQPIYIRGIVDSTSFYWTMWNTTYLFGDLGLSPINAFSIDRKIDNGMPSTGTVIARHGEPPNNIPSITSVSTMGYCTIGLMLPGFYIGPNDTYNIYPTTGGNFSSCSLRIRMN